MALLSLFDGLGTARLGLNDLLRHLHATHTLTHGWFVESDDTLRAAVANVWARQTSTFQEPSYQPLGTDVFNSCSIRPSCSRSLVSSLLLLCY